VAATLSMRGIFNFLPQIKTQASTIAVVNAWVSKLQIAFHPLWEGVGLLNYFLILLIGFFTPFILFLLNPPPYK
jgi:hypothetical protein